MAHHDYTGDADACDGAGVSDGPHPWLTHCRYQTQSASSLTPVQRAGVDVSMSACRGEDAVQGPRLDPGGLVWEGGNRKCPWR